MPEITLMGQNIDKLTESYTLKIPEILKVRLDKLSAPARSKMKEQLLIAMAKACHDYAFQAESYLSTQD